MHTSANLSKDLTRTSVRGWAVNLMAGIQQSTFYLTSFSFGLFLPFISDDIGLSHSEAGVLQGVWWITSALLTLPASTWFSRFRPIPLILMSLLLMLPFFFMQGVAQGFLTLFLARFFLVIFHTLTAPTAPLLLQQWVAPQHYATYNAVYLSLHSVLLAVVISTAALIIEAVDSWRTAYLILGGFLAAQTVAWVLTARESYAPVKELGTALSTQQETPLRALITFPQAWVIGVVMFGMSATWTALVTFLPTLWLEERGLELNLGGPLLGFLYYALIPSALAGGWVGRKLQNRKMLLFIPAFLNLALGLLITITPYPALLIVLISSLGIIWTATPAIIVLPFEFPGITPREVAVVTATANTLAGLGYAAGPFVTGLVSDATGSLELGLIVLCLITGVGAVAALFYPRRRDPSITDSRAGQQPS